MSSSINDDLFAHVIDPVIILCRNGEKYITRSSKWKYVGRCMDAGMEESMTRTIDLSDKFHRSTIEFIYFWIDWRPTVEDCIHERKVNHKYAVCYCTGAQIIKDAFRYCPNDTGTIRMTADMAIGLSDLVECTGEVDLEDDAALFIRRTLSNQFNWKW